jgi:hypothetical protein
VRRKRIPLKRKARLACIFHEAVPRNSIAQIYQQITTGHIGQKI